MPAPVSRKLSRLHKPPDLSLEAWQRELRRQFGREQSFKVTNAGTESVFSDFEVSNPRSGSTYRVAIRGPQPGDNDCSCPDFATNALGTCKHAEFVLHKLERRTRTREVLRSGFQPPYSEIVLQYGAKRDVRFRRGTSCPRSLTALAAKYFDAQQHLRADTYATFESFLSRAARFDHDLRCYDDVLGFVAEVRDRSRRERRIAEAFPRGVRDPGLRKLLKGELYEYQREGALFAARAGRCLIGDEMGLGKTIQALAATEVMARQLGVERVLIVCPTSLKHQWEREIARFTERRALVVGGLRVRREQLYAAQDGFFRITNYDSVHADLDLIGKWSPDLVILDEAQRIKNWNTRIARSVKRIASPYAIVLTGTPLENRLEELVSIVEFVDKHRLGPTFRFLAAHQMRDENGKVVVFSQWVRMLELLVRRLKGKRVDHVLFHGGVEGTRRKALVDRFREDDRCRVFLSTDAGGVGLNLQQASTVVNMDLPWNPAVMEQRIGRVHRLGQQNPVRVINFIAEGTIEEGMLSVLKFKKSLFAGVLDGGEREVFLGGSRLSRFMETVEHATASAQQPNIAGDRVRASKSHVATERRVGATSPAAVAGDWAALMQSGLAWFEQFATVARAAGDGRADGLRVIHRDPQTGQDYLKIPVPSPEVLDRALQTIGSLLNRFRP